MPSKWQINKRTLVNDFKIYSVYTHAAFHPQKNIHFDFTVIHSDDFVNVIAVTSSQKIVMVRQFRQGIEDFTLELAGGLLDPEDKDTVNGGLRELKEETGYTSKNARSLGWIHTNPAMMNNKSHFVLALDCEPTHDTKFDHTEDIEIELVPVKDIPQLILDHKITHALTVCALNRYLLMREQVPA